MGRPGTHKTIALQAALAGLAVSASGFYTEEFRDTIRELSAILQI
jgi:hypothetical protein